jgi:hypothetical protein
VGQVEPGSSVVYTHQLANTGNVPLSDVLLSGTPDAASDNGWSVVLYEDTNGDGVWDPTDTVISEGVALQTAGADGILDVGESLAVFAKVFAPASVAYGITNVKTLTVNADGARHHHNQQYRRGNHQGTGSGLGLRWYSRWSGRLQRRQLFCFHSLRSDSRGTVRHLSPDSHQYWC